MEFKSGTIFMIMRLGLMLIPMCVPRLFFFFWPPVDIVSAFYTLFVVTWARGLAQQPESMPKTKSLTFFIIRDVHEKKDDKFVACKQFAAAKTERGWRSHSRGMSSRRRRVQRCGLDSRAVSQKRKSRGKMSGWVGDRNRVKESTV